MSSIKILQGLNGLNSSKIVLNVTRYFYIPVTIVLSWIATRYHLNHNKAAPVISDSQKYQAILDTLEKHMLLTTSLNEFSQKTNQIVTDFIEHQFLLTKSPSLLDKPTPFNTLYRQHNGQMAAAITNFKQAEKFINFAYRSYHKENRNIDQTKYELFESFKLGDIWLQVSRNCDFIQLMGLNDFLDYCKMKKCDFTIGHEFMDADKNIVRKLWVAKESEIKTFLSQMIE